MRAAKVVAARAVGERAAAKVAVTREARWAVAVVSRAEAVPMVGSVVKAVLVAVEARVEARAARAEAVVEAMCSHCGSGLPNGR